MQPDGTNAGTRAGKGVLHVAAVGGGGVGRRIAGSAEVFTGNILLRLENCKHLYGCSRHAGGIGKRVSGRSDNCAEGHAVASFNHSVVSGRARFKVRRADRRARTRLVGARGDAADDRKGGHDAAREPLLRHNRGRRGGYDHGGIACSDVLVSRAGRSCRGADRNPIASAHVGVGRDRALLDALEVGACGAATGGSPGKCGGVVCTDNLRERGRGHESCRQHGSVKQRPA